MDIDNQENDQNLWNKLREEHFDDKNSNANKTSTETIANYEESNNNDAFLKSNLDDIVTNSEGDDFITNTDDVSVSKTIDENSSSNDKFLIKKPLKNIIDSDSDEDNVNNKSSSIAKGKKRMTIIDSDSEDMPTPHNKSFDENLHNEPVIYISDKNGKIIPENNVEHNLKRLSKLCDSESSADEIEKNDEYDHNFEEASPLVPTKTLKSRRSKEQIEKPKKMTGKEALQQRREIRSESQRMTREMNVSLPYHRPKMRSLKEFLERRPKFASTVPTETVHVSPAVALKMNKQQLEIISKNLSEREKQVEEYFKSDSEPEEEIEVNKGSKEAVIEESTQANEEKCLTDDIIRDNHEDAANRGTSNLEHDSNFNNDLEHLNENDNISPETNQKTMPTEESDEINSEAHNMNVSENQEIGEGSSVVILGNVLVQKPLNIDYDNFENINSENNITEINEIIPEESRIEELIEKYTKDEKNESFTIVPEKKKNITEILKERLGDFKPSLSRSDDFINLDENVNNLMQRFVKHTTRKQPHKHNVHLNIVSVTNGEVQKEKLEIVEEDDTIPILEKPGERLKKLRDELESKMAEQRSKFWHERIHGKREISDEESVKNKAIDSEDEDLLDKVDEDEFTEIEDDEDGDEIIGDNDDQEIDDEDSGNNKKSEFFENEAEEDHDCEDTKHGTETEDDEDMDVDKTADDESIDADDEDEQLSTDPKKKKKLRRIIQAFENDSDDEDSNGLIELANNVIKNSLYLDTTDTLDELSGPTPHQRRQDHTPIKPTGTQTKSDLGFLTPVIQLTGLQSLNSGSKFLHDSPVSPFTMPKTSPSRMSQSGPQKKLFADDNISDSQMLDDLAEVCSGKFTSQTQQLESECSEENTSNLQNTTPNNILNTNSDNATTSEIYDEPVTSTQDFLEICSGKFTGITQLETPIEKNVIANEELSKINMCVPEPKQDEIRNENSFPKATNFTTIMTSNDEIKDFNDKDDERLISQLLDEDELERFKKKFESPEKQIGRKILDSDDETEITVKKKKVKNCISDEEEEEQADGGDEIDSENYTDDEDKSQEVEYDSEENEIDVAKQKKKLKASDFFEDEAELSESEWGSADEDEKDMDVLEFEEGDKEKLDERKVKRDLERIHLRRILDDDNHEVKMLQEILLDDGELHGSGRERQFKWRNIDNTDNNDENAVKEDDGEVYIDDDNENEERWRKTRFEREIFLKKQQETSQNFEESIIEMESTSQIFKLGQAAIKRSLSNTPNTTANNNSDVPDVKASFTLVNKKGSFLSRSEQILARVAEITSKSVNPTIGGAKNSRNFVFHTRQSTTEIEEIELQNVRKRKADEGTPAAIKKLRLNNISPAVKKLQKSDKVKNLFANW